MAGFSLSRKKVYTTKRPSKYSNIGTLKNPPFSKKIHVIIRDLTDTKNAEGNYVLAQRLGSEDMGMPGPQAGPDGSEGMDEKMMERMAAMFAGLRVAMSFVVPGEIIESNAMQVEGKRASWIYDIRLVPVDNSLIFISFVSRLRAKRTDSLTNRFFLLSIRPV